MSLINGNGNREIPMAKISYWSNWVLLLLLLCGFWMLTRVYDDLTTKVDKISNDLSTRPQDVLMELRRGQSNLENLINKNHKMMLELVPAAEPPDGHGTTPAKEG